MSVHLTRGNLFNSKPIYNTLYYRGVKDIKKAIDSQIKDMLSEAAEEPITEIYLSPYFGFIGFTESKDMYIMSRLDYTSDKDFMENIKTKFYSCKIESIEDCLIIDRENMIAKLAKCSGTARCKEQLAEYELKVQNALEKVKEYLRGDIENTMKEPLSYLESMGMIDYMVDEKSQLKRTLAKVIEEHKRSRTDHHLVKKYDLGMPRIEVVRCDKGDKGFSVFSFFFTEEILEQIDLNKVLLYAAACGQGEYDDPVINIELALMELGWYSKPTLGSYTEHQELICDLHEMMQTPYCENLMSKLQDNSPIDKSQLYRSFTERTDEINYRYMNDLISCYIGGAFGMYTFTLGSRRICIYLYDTVLKFWFISNTQHIREAKLYKDGALSDILTEAYDVTSKYILCKKCVEAECAINMPEFLEIYDNRYEELLSKIKEKGYILFDNSEDNIGFDLDDRTLKVLDAGYLVKKSADEFDRRNIIKSMKCQGLNIKIEDEVLNLNDVRLGKDNYYLFNTSSKKYRVKGYIPGYDKDIINAALAQSVYILKTENRTVTPEEVLCKSQELIEQEEGIYFLTIEDQECYSRYEVAVNKYDVYENEITHITSTYYPSEYTNIEDQLRICDKFYAGLVGGKLDKPEDLHYIMLDAVVHSTDRIPYSLDSEDIVEGFGL